MNSPHEFRRLREAADPVKTGHAAVALATLVRTSGSTYRHAGTSMLVDAAGNVTCALAGGCPQHDLVQRALHTLARDAPEIARYNRETGLDVLIESGCGGELEVLIEPLSSARDVRFLDALAALHQRRACGCLATVYARGGVPWSPRPQRLVASDHVEWSDIGNVALRERVAQRTNAVHHTQRARVELLTLARTTYTVLFEPLQPAHRVVIFGANAGAAALARLAVLLGWSCVLVDPAPQSMAVAMEGVRFVHADAAGVRDSIAFDVHTSVVTMTHNLERDTRLLAALAGAPLAYVGMIGSRERAARIRARLPATLHVHAPAGLDIGAQTPEEIALAVAAEILANVHARSTNALAMLADAVHA